VDSVDRWGKQRPDKGLRQFELWGLRVAKVRINSHYAGKKDPVPPARQGRTQLIRFASAGLRLVASSWRPSARLDGAYPGRAGRRA
jgi:hypothetical protein